MALLVAQRRFVKKGVGGACLKIDMEKFDPIKNFKEEEQGTFWDEYSKNFISIEAAQSTKSLLRGEIRLCGDFLRSSDRSNKGKILKLDLWNEAHHTAILTYIHHFYDEVHAIDISPDVVRQALKKLEEKNIKVKAVIGDMRKMPYPDNSFDYVYTMGTIEHIPRPQDAMEEIFRVLKPGGRAVIGVPNKYEWFGKSLILDFFALTGIKEDGYEHSYGWRQFTRELEDSGLRVLRKTGAYFMPWFIRAADWFLAQRLPKAAIVLWPFIKFSDYLSNSNFFLKHGSVVVAVVEKPHHAR
ncbi:MAG: class I SAM-dependent methyltransferase [Candidatus Harrisonbacteria bacterium]|nr:class I SAM-dependent methyltransferase [Candidatus Harrisonbacteria bacterium]